MATLPHRGQAALEENPLKADELLFWLSAQHEGSWQQFRIAVEELHSAESDLEPDSTAAADNNRFPLYQDLRLDLQRLAHVEFFSHDCENGWRVAPPTLAAHGVYGALRAVLCGEAAHRRCAIGCFAHAKKLVEHRFLRHSRVFRFVSPDVTALGEAAEQAGVLFQPDAPFAMLSQLPRFVARSKRDPQSEFPLGADWDIHQFDRVCFAGNQQIVALASLAQWGISLSNLVSA